MQINSFLQENNTLEEFQSALRTHHTKSGVGAGRCVSRTEAKQQVWEDLDYGEGL